MSCSADHPSETVKTIEPTMVVGHANRPFLFNKLNTPVTSMANTTYVISAVLGGMAVLNFLNIQRSLSTLYKPVQEKSSRISLHQWGLRSVPIFLIPRGQFGMPFAVVSMRRGNGLQSGRLDRTRSTVSGVFLGSQKHRGANHESAIWFGGGCVDAPFDADVGGSVSEPT